VRRLSQDSKIKALKSAPLFDGLSRKELVELARRTEDIEIPAGKVLCKEGDTGREFFVIVDGEATVTRKGKRITGRGPGDFFGEIALLEDTPRMATVTAKSPLRVLVLTGPDFRHLLDQTPNVERKVLRALARRLVELSGDPTLA
jgi:CRP/FNR family transcriptional regulator, cyclic AMP receptor protein